MEGERLGKGCGGIGICRSVLSGLPDRSGLFVPIWITLTDNPLLIWRFWSVTIDAHWKRRTCASICICGQGEEGGVQREGSRS